MSWKAPSASRRRDRTATQAELGRLVKTGGTVPTLGAIATGGWRGFPGVTAADYVPRPDFDEEFRAALNVTSAPFPFDLVYGDDQAGKSTSAWQGVTSVLDPAVSVLAPRDGTALAEMANRGEFRSVVRTPTLVWADDLSAADLNLLTPEMLDRLAEMALVVATISAASCAEILDGNNHRSIARAAFKRAYLVHLPYDPAVIERIVPTSDACVRVWAGRSRVVSAVAGVVVDAGQQGSGPVLDVVADAQRPVVVGLAKLVGALESWAPTRACCGRMSQHGLPLQGSSPGWLESLLTSRFGGYAVAPSTSTSTVRPVEGAR